MQAKVGTGVLVAGRATKDAEFKTVGDNETPLAVFSLAVNANGEDGVFANCKAFGSPLALYAKGIKKGDAVIAAGVMEEREYKERVYKDLNCQWLNYVGKAEAARPARRELADESALDINPGPEDFALIDESEDLPF